MRRRYLLIGLAALVAPATGTAREVVTLATSPAGVETLTATIAGQKGIYLFDTGIGTSGMTPAVAASVGCTPWGKVTGFRAIGERLDVQRCNGAPITIGGFATNLPQWSVFDLKRFMGPASAGLSGAIGLDVFAGQTVTLDVAHHRLTIEDTTSLAVIRATAIAVPIRLARGSEGAALTADMGVPTASGMTWMELDTGNYGPSMVDRTIAGLFALKPAEVGVQRWHVTPKPGLSFSGSVTVKDLILDGNLGRDVLRHWLVTLDLVHGRGWIRTAPAGAD